MLDQSEKSVQKSQQQQQQNSESDDKLNESRVFVELTSYIEEAVNSGTLLFKLSEIHSLYMNRLEDLGIEKLVNKTRLKVDLLENFSEALEQFDGVKDGMKNMLKDPLKEWNFAEDAAILAKAAAIVRNDIFSHKCFKFTGTFPSKCQEDSLPSSLKSLVSLILNGPDLTSMNHRLVLLLPRLYFTM